MCFCLARVIVIGTRDYLNILMYVLYFLYLTCNHFTSNEQCQNEG